ncbi:MAG: tetratricopeptide (TPR) repeat protein [Alphaproteobacteria bacterium]|jgi:tetratricopeptide (TPR) repeat protein
MRNNLSQLSQQARLSVQRRDWARVYSLAHNIQELDKNEPEGYFLLGLAQKASGRTQMAVDAFAQALSFGPQRYDAAIELAQLYLLLLRHGDAYGLLCHHEQLLNNSPLYLDMAAMTFSGLGLHTRAWPLYQKANQLQPDIDMFREHLAACGVLLGKVKEATAIYKSLCDKYPQHQRNHYELSKLGTAKDNKHIAQMQDILASSKSSPDKNIFMYYAIGKELEDLGRWKESFEYYKMGGEAVITVANYDVANDIKLIEKIKNTCTADWLSANTPSTHSQTLAKTPIFIVGLPRTGTTLVERILSSHSQVESADETFFMQMAIRQASGAGGIQEVDESIIESAAQKDILLIAKHYMNSVEYRLSDRPMFIDKYPYNYLYLGFIAKAFPNAQIIYLKRNPMDACFAMFKQSFFKFAYSLDDLGHYYVAQDNLQKHWKSILGDRLIEVNYESLVTMQEANTKEILGKLGLEFEQACLDFEKNPASSATASTLQVREKIHTRSVNKWKHFSDELAPLQKFLNQADIKTN